MHSLRGREYTHTSFKKHTTPILVLALTLSALPSASVSAAITPSPHLEALIAAADQYAPRPTPLPQYSYTAAGSVYSSPSPVTEVAQWQTEVPVAAPVVATAPVPAPVAPTTGQPLVLEGEASFYSRAGCLGCSPALTMANGQPLNDNALTMAIGADKKHLVGRRARVTNLVTGKSVEVLITDTGGFYKARYGNRVADLTIATKNAIGMAGGVGQVRVEVL